MSAWIESHIDLGDHPKVSELCFQLQIKKFEAVGHLTLLWHFTMKYSWEVGDLRRFSSRVICEAVGWDKDPDTFIRALQATGWLEPDSLVVHDWLEYAGKLVRDRVYQKSRRKTATNGDSFRETSVTQPNLTEPKKKADTPPPAPQRQAFTKPSFEEVVAYTKERGSLVNPGKFYDHYESNGWKVGKNPMKDWKAAARKWEPENAPAKEEAEVLT